MKKHFYILLFLTSCTIFGKRSLVDITLAHANRDNKILVKVAAEKQKQLKNLKQERVKYEQDLIKINKLVEEIKVKIVSTENEGEHRLLEEIDQILCKLTLEQKKLISFLDTFMKEIEAFLKNLPSLQSIITYPVNTDAKQLTATIATQQELIDQLISKKSNLQTKYEKEKQKAENIILSLAHNNEKSNLSPLTKQLNGLKQKLDQLYIKKHDYSSSLIALHILKEKIDLSLLKKKAKNNASSPSNHSTFNAVHGPLPNCIQNSSFISKVATLVGLGGSAGIFMHATKKKEQESKKNTNPAPEVKDKIKKKKKDRKKELEQVEQEKKPTKVPQENFNQYYGTVPPEIMKIYNQLKTLDPQDKQSDESLPKGLFLVGSGRKFLIKCLAQELRVSFHSIPFELIFERLLKDEGNENTLETIVKQLQKEAKQTHAKAVIIHIDQIALSPDLEQAQRLFLLRKLSMKMEQIKCEEENEPRVVIIGSLSNSLARYKRFIESKELKVIKIPPPNKKIREKIINESLKSKLPNQTLDYLIESTKGMGVNFLQDTIQKLSLTKEKETTISEQDIRKVIKEKKGKKRKFLLKQTKMDGCSWHHVGLEQYIGEVPKPLQNFIDKMKTNDSNTSILRKILLAGPSGSGKKYLAQCVAGQFRAPFFQMPQQFLHPSAKENGFDFQDYILNAQKIAQKDQARTVVIYIDHIDLYREKFESSSKQIVLTSLSAKIQNIEQSTDDSLPHVLLIASLTDSQEDNPTSPILEELIGPDVFERTVEILSPKEKNRKKALKQFGRYDQSIRLDNLAKKTIGMYPSEIRKFLHQAKISAEDRGSHKISQEDIQMAGKNLLLRNEDLLEHEESTDNFLPLGFEGFAGTIPPEIYKFCTELHYLESFKKNYKLFLPTGILLGGPPGTGKTLLVNAIAKKYNCLIETRSGADFAKKYIGEGANQVGTLFAQLRRMAKNPKNRNKKAIIFFVDEAEVLLRAYDDHNKAGMNATRAKFLHEMNRIKEDRKNGEPNRPPIIVFAATNHAIKDLDKASIRPGRFDSIIMMELPKEKDQVEILAHHLKDRPLDKNVKLSELIKKIEIRKLSGADLELIAGRATFEAAKQNSHIDTSCLIKGIETAKKEIRKRKKGKSNY